MNRFMKKIAVVLSFAVAAILALIIAFIRKRKKLNNII